MPEEPPSPPAEVPEVPEPNYRCQKCGRPYQRGGLFLKRHEDRCDGKPWDPGAPVIKNPRAEAAAPPPKKVPPSPFDSILKQARQEREGIRTEIEHHEEKKEILAGHIARLTVHAEKIDQMIVDLEKAQTA